MRTYEKHRAEVVQGQRATGKSASENQVEAGATSLVTQVDGQIRAVLCGVCVCVCVKIKYE